MHISLPLAENCTMVSKYLFYKWTVLYSLCSLYNNIVAISNFLHCTASKQKNEKSLFPPFFSFVLWIYRGKTWIGSTKKRGCLNPSSLLCIIFVFGKKNYSLFQTFQKTVDSSVSVRSLLFSSSRYPLRVNLEAQNIVGLPWLIGGVATCLCKWSHRNCSSQMAVSLSLCDSVSATTLSGVFPHGCLGLWLPPGVKSNICIDIFRIANAEKRLLGVCGNSRGVDMHS